MLCVPPLRVGLGIDAVNELMLRNDVCFMIFANRLKLICDLHYFIINCYYFVFR